jgi:hypothetical protein
MLRSRSVKMPDGSFRLMEDVPSEADLAAHGGRVISRRDAQAIAGNTVYVSGEIPRRSGFEVDMPGQHRRTLDNQGRELDELLIDERFVAFHVRDKRLPPQMLSASVELPAADVAVVSPHFHPVISGMSSPWREIYALCSISLSRIACLA